MLPGIAVIISSLFILCFSSRSVADLTFGSAINACVQNVDFRDLKCDEGTSCTSETVEKKIWPCLEKLNIKKSGCEITRAGATCDSPYSERIFPNTSGCAMVVSQDNRRRITTYLSASRSKKNPCIIDGVETEISKEDISPRIYSDIADAIPGPNKTWIAQRPIIAYGFEKAVPFSNIIVLSTHRPSYPPWNDSESSCTEPTFAYICGNLDDGQSCEVEQTKLRKKVGLEGHSDFFPQRHYVGRNGPKSFPVVREFKLKKATKICSVLVPKDTVLTSEIDDTVCSAMTDGAIRLNGFPIALFPALQKPNVKSVPSVMCSPRASETSNIAKMARPEAKALPALNWQECVCHLDPTYFE